MQIILVIESDPAALVAQSFVLRSFGYAVLEAGSRGEAWRACNEHQGPIDLVMMKAVADNDNSQDFITRLQLVCPQLRALVVCDPSSVEVADKQRLPCECAFLQKPFRVETLAEVLRELVGGSKEVASSFS